MKFAAGVELGLPSASRFKIVVGFFVRSEMKKPPFQEAFLHPKQRILSLRWYFEARCWRTFSSEVVDLYGKLIPPNDSWILTVRDFRVFHAV